MWESIQWLVPSIKVPTWTDVLAMLGVFVVGLALIRWGIKPIVNKCAAGLEKRHHPVMSDM